jgi:hypothetical protein
MGKLEKEAYLQINKADLRLGTNTGGSSATPRDWVTITSPPGKSVGGSIRCLSAPIPATSPALADLIQPGIPDPLAPSFLF